MLFTLSINVSFLSLQRGSDELLSQTGAVSNGSVMSPAPNHADNNNDAKKVSVTSWFGSGSGSPPPPWAGTGAASLIFTQYSDTQQ